jgi:hypothetical protein
MGFFYDTLELEYRGEYEEDNDKFDVSGFNKWHGIF